MESKHSSGYRFVPTDEELIFHYLLKKINNHPLPADVIQVVNFSDHGPDILTREYPPVGDKEWYFFTPRIRNSNKRRANLLENQQEEEEQVAVRENRGEEEEVVASGVSEVVEAHDNLNDQYYYGINNNINAAANSNLNANAMDNCKDYKE
ncbi:PREDICTED: NAC domain-containing protein 68-like [Erythranthe guttata]|uniref:NAC domain-containing protein 68-like n=1 Tax=Erythranthe guttata TaxID=4155 RepID=UPI00064D73F4|nr:PREDICTED: NAC domain-containing protein 68-like [Erythranthe guttata]|eukprot:XP_012842627.1 PREDICTED: NAC domain-containing protein 68-like [Erythranthe guttata]